MRPLTLLVAAEFAAIVVLAILCVGGAPADAAPPRDEVRPADTGVAAPPDAATGSASAASSPAPVERVDAETTPAFRADDPVGVVLSGTVTADGEAVAGASVWLSREGANRSGEEGAPGYYAVAGLGPGEWSLRCRAEGFAEHEATCTLDERAFQQLDIELRRQVVVRVKVQDAGGQSIMAELAEQAMFGTPYVVATEAPLTGDLPDTESSRALRFGVGEWRGLWGISSREANEALRAQGYAGELLLDRAPPLHAALLLRTTLLQSQRVDPGQEEVVFTIEAADVLGKFGTLSLRLLDDAGHPIPDTRIRLSTAQGGGSAGVTDAEGRARIERVLPGLNVLELHMKPALESVLRHVRVRPGEAVDLGDLRLSARVEVGGVVFGADGTPATGATVQWTELDSRTFPQPLATRRSTRADAEGKFTLHGCGAHRYAVFARLQDGAMGYAAVDATGGAPPPVTITVAESTPIALRADFPATVGYTVSVLAANRLPVAVATLGSGYRPSSIRLLPGSYTVEIHDMQTDALRRSFALNVGSEPLTIDVP